MFQNIKDNLTLAVKKETYTHQEKNDAGLLYDDLEFPRGHCVSNKVANLSAGLCNKLLYQFIVSDSPEKKYCKI